MSFTTALNSKSKKLFKELQSSLQEKKSFNPAVAHLVKEDGKGFKSTLPNVYVTCCEIVRNVEKAAQLYFLASGSMEKPPNMEAAAKLICTFIDTRLQEMKVSIEKGEVKWLDNKALQKMKEPLLKIIKDGEWKVRTLSQAVLASNVKKQIFFFRLLSEEKEWKEKMSKFESPRPQAPNKKEAKRLQKALASGAKS